MSRLRSTAGLVLVVALMLATVPFAKAAGPVEGVEGEGSAAAPFLVATAEALASVADHVNAGNPAIHIRLTSDAHGEFPGFTELTGTLDGDGHTISNIGFAPTATSDAGLVHRLAGGTIRDLAIDGLSVAGAGNVGGLAVLATGGAVLDGNAVINADLRSIPEGGFAPRAVQSLPLDLLADQIRWNGILWDVAI